MIEREVTPHLGRLINQYPVLTITGPRQSGKTTLCRRAFGDLPYANLEDPDVRDFATSDPRAFLAQFPSGAVLDEIQRAPDLPSYLQGLVDEDPQRSRFVLTGSEQFGWTDSISQSLAGRAAVLRLLPFTLAECALAGASGDLDEILFTGGYPSIHAQGRAPAEALGDYVTTYVERDVRRIGAIQDLAAFTRFMRLAAGRVGQLLNVTNLANDAGVAPGTARSWLSVLQASDIVFLLEPHLPNIRKRLTKSPKLYFVDVGLAGYLIGIRAAEQVATHPLRGNLFENVVVGEALKHAYNAAVRHPRLSFFRTSAGLECDLLYPTASGLAAVEIKSGATLHTSWFSHLARIKRDLPAVSAAALVYGGTQRQHRTAGEAVPLRQFAEYLTALDAPPPDRAPGGPDRPAAAVTTGRADETDDG